jgi:hypothetical protein
MAGQPSKECLSVCRGGDCPARRSSYAGRSGVMLVSPLAIYWQLRCRASSPAISAQGCAAYLKTRDRASWRTHRDSKPCLSIARASEDTASDESRTPKAIIGKALRRTD